MSSLAVRYRSPSGTPLISVTQVLTVAGRIEDDWFTPAAAARGSRVHALTEVFDQGGSLAGTDDVAGYLDAYAAMVATVKPVYAASELAVSDLRLGLAGRIDRVCSSLFGRPGLLDLKTGEPSPWHAWQLALYNRLKPTGSRWVCYLSANGRYRMRQYADPQDDRQAMYDVARVRQHVTEAGGFWIAR